MKIISSILVLMIICCCANGKESVYQASTPAHLVVRNFLGISLQDSIDFIRWKLTMRANNYALNCQYGIGKPNTNGFIDEKRVVFTGKLSKQGNYYLLQQQGRTIYLFEVNNNLLYLLDKNKNMLVGNGGWSYALNNVAPVKTDQFNLSIKQNRLPASMAFEGRTPCKELSKLMGSNRSGECYKMKWYIILFTDPATGKPTYYLKGGRGYKKETMARGKWEIVTNKNGRVIYKLDPEKQQFAVHLLKADDNILFFTDADGNLLVGDEDFSYNLNRTKDREP